MTPRFLLDTNILAEPLRPAPNEAILEKLKRYQDEIAIASVVWNEMWFGCYRLPVSARRQAIEMYLTQVVATSIPILPYDAEAAEWHAMERARLTSSGKTPSYADGMIASVAKTNDLVLVTLNRSDYIEFRDLQTETWQD